MPELAVKPLTFDEVEVLEDRDSLRYELWDGQPVAMTGGTLTHNLIALGLRDVIKPQLKPGCHVTVADVGLRFNPSVYSNKAYPDIMVICDPELERYQTRPMLVAEVLSESSVGRDRNEKFKAYTSLDSVEVYLILSQTAIEVEVYRRFKGWSEELYRGGEAVIELRQLELRLPLREIYQDVWNDLTGSGPAES